MCCQLDTLRRCIPASIRKALNELPITLDETYERTLQRIPEEQREHAHRLFQCLIAAIRPLRLEELAEIFAIQFDSDVSLSLEEGWRPVDPEAAVLTACSSLITIVDVEGSKIIQFSHFSVKEFLTSERIATSKVGSTPQHYIQLEPAHTILAQACLAVLLQLDESTDDERMRTFPLAMYAARHWVDHAKFKNVASHVRDAMERLFDPQRPHLPVWTWIYDIHRNRSLYETPLAGVDREERFTAATSLFYAVCCGFSGLVEHLITKHPECINDEGHTPLHKACYEEDLECMRLLLEHGADVDARDGRNYAPLHLAAKYGRVEALRLLLQYNSDVNVKGPSNETPLYIASRSGLTEVVQVLLEHGADINAQTNRHWTPLFAAVFFRNLDVIRLLLKHGADVRIEGELLEGRKHTPLYQAIRSKNHDVVEILSEYGAMRGQDCWRCGRKRLAPGGLRQRAASV
jgi:Ankyrin repeats (many copies)